MVQLIMKLLSMLFGLILCATASADTVRIFSPYSPSHSATPAMFRIIDQANRAQNTYLFVLEFRPGGNQTIALQALDSTSLAIVAPAFVENVSEGRITESDYVPLHALGDACWTVIINGAITDHKEITVGGVGFGNATHLTALALGEKYKFTTKYIVFKSNNDALINMAGNNGIFMVVDRYESFTAMKSRNANLQAFAASCPTRLPQAPDMKTLREIGIDATYVFNITVAHRSMDPARRRAVAAILNDAQKSLGADEIFKLSGMRIPESSAEEFYSTSIRQVRRLQEKYRNDINQSK
ncbi:hypothetical protein [Haliscomenobacter sp.]|uniref:hypothetical protein n=1 Tax=Haliscomenobacter sp. TaxID=2717303 RepID=UPI003364C721